MTSVAIPAPRRPIGLVLLGIGLIVAVLGAGTLILLTFGETFTSYDPVRALLPSSSTAVALGSPVEYRNVSVGKVTSTGRALPGGITMLQLHIDPGQLAHIPAGVRATVAPVSIFGNQYVVLVPPAHPGTATLRRDATIAALQTDRTASLQATLSDLDRVLIELHPGQLDAAFTAIADALQGQGTRLGHTLVAGHTYLEAMVPLWPQVVADLQRLDPVAAQLTLSTPNILAIFRNTEAPSHTVTAAGPQFARALSGGSTLADQATSLLTGIQAPFSVLAAASGPFLDDIANNPHEIAEVLSGLSTWASTWTAAESSGPFLNLTATVPVANPADLGLALLGGSQGPAALAAGLGPGYVDPATYTTSAPIPAAAAETATASMVAGLSGHRPASSALATLILAPVLDHLESGS